MEWVCDGVVYIEVLNYQEGDVQGWGQGFWEERVDTVVTWVGGVGVYQPEGVKVGPEKRLLGGDIVGEDIIHPLEPWEHRKRGKER